MSVSNYVIKTHSVDVYKNSIVLLSFCFINYFLWQVTKNSSILLAHKCSRLGGNCLVKVPKDDCKGMINRSKSSHKLGEIGHDKVQIIYKYMRLIYKYKHWLIVLVTQIPLR